MIQVKTGGQVFLFLLAKVVMPKNVCDLQSDIEQTTGFGVEQLTLLQAACRVYIQKMNR